MGRYISGDVEGKCWFAIQSSDFMDRFGSSFYEPSYICYSYCKDDLEAMREEFRAIEESMGDQMQKYDKFFSESSWYNNKMLEEAGLDLKHLNEYADYKFAKKVEACVVEYGDCNFEVEC